MSWTVYLIETESCKLYCGITNNMKRRFLEHQEKPQGAKFFHFSKATKIVYQEIVETRSLALKREAAIKKLTKQEKLALKNSSPNF